jgi:hypothetical protein
MEILLDNCNIVAEFDFPNMTTELAGQDLIADPELQVRATTIARENPSFAGIECLAWRICCLIGLPVYCTPRVVD